MPQSTKQKTTLKMTRYDQLQRTVSKTPQHDMTLVMGDLNAKVGSDYEGRESAMGRHGCGNINDNGERLVDFCLSNRLVIGGTIFPHKNIHKLTWNSPDGNTINQIDHVMVNKKWQRSLLDVRVYRGADVGSDHHLVVSKIRLKLRATPPTKKRHKVFDTHKLHTPEIKHEFALELRNRFQALENLEDEGEQDIVETTWNTITKVYSETAEKVLGYRKRKDKEWITPETWRNIEERKRAKGKMLNTKSRRAKDIYRNKNKEVKRSARRDKRAYVEELASEAERSATRGELIKVYRITKTLCNQNSACSVPIKDRQGKLLTNEKEQAERWAQHFEEVLNRPEPDEPADPAPSEDIPINTDPPTLEEVETAIKAMKNRKAPGIDAIQAELLKADCATATLLLTDLFAKIWEHEVIPQDWSKGLIFKIPKKGDLSNCNNWRGITLLSIPSKVFCRILLKRIDSVIDPKLREEQAGFRKGRGCADQLFALRNIIEQCVEWNSPLLINFIDFQKAFDSVHRESLWKILRAYGIPHKIVTIIGKFYEHFECNVITGNSLSKPFCVKSGVRQGCILSPILFLITIDWVMRATTSDRPRGIKWTPNMYLEELDFADDLAALSSVRTSLQEKTDRLSDRGKQTGLYINKKKTQVMYINTSTDPPISINGEALEGVGTFTYLGSVMSGTDGTQRTLKPA
ncbi:Hypp8389 [Branchiostoma lanceolatum]|uniref:Hypp8389 protein n=1 Tax=Branchiostoma lanceolatum TaxID=7740 RepID=A0A8J9Z6M4_BRALA|nr:Hypp8389 [Branchiostoma lanceolatum]